MRNVFLLVLFLIIASSAVYIFIGRDFINNTQEAVVAPPPILDTKTGDSQNPDSSLSTVLAEGLDTPWAIAFLPDRSILLTERPGRLRKIDSSGKLNPLPIPGMPKVNEIGEGGLLGITLHPQFTSNNYLYLYYTYSGSGDATLNRVSRLTYQNNQLLSEVIIIDQIPGAGNHNGGRIKFGPDGFLYITTGDAGEPSQAQNKDNLAGKILRVTDLGQAAAGNPFNNLVYSLGHRNPQGIAWDSSGNLWQTEHGRSSPTGFDEVNLIKAGNNYGWPEFEGDKKADGMIPPVRHSGATNTWAPAGADFIGNSLFYGGLKGQTLYEVVLKDNKIAEFKEHFKGEYGRIREVITGPDGMLYITTSNQDGRGSPASADDRIIRIDTKKL